jgi:hypothetical protein
VACVLAAGLGVLAEVGDVSPPERLHVLVSFEPPWLVRPTPIRLGGRRGMRRWCASRSAGLTTLTGPQSSVSVRSREQEDWLVGFRRKTPVASSTLRGPGACFWCEARPFSKFLCILPGRIGIASYFRRHIICTLSNGNKVFLLFKLERAHPYTHISPSQR